MAAIRVLRFSVRGSDWAAHYFILQKSDVKKESEDDNRAIISCPKCGKEISDKAKKCIHCGNVLVEQVQPTKTCAECGKEIPVDVQECPFCGCPIDSEKSESVAVTQKAKTNKKPIIVVVAIAVVAILVGLVIAFAGPILNKDEQLAYQNAVAMRKMLRDPDSFKLYDEMFLLKKLNDDGSLECTYTVFEYGGTNGYGGIVRSEAIFKDDTYIMDYDDDIEVGDSNFMDKISASSDLNSYVLGLYPEKFQMVDIDIEKIKDKMGLE